jgi:hypothetical protein
VEFRNLLEGRALLAIEELRGQSTVFALGAAGGSLLCRIRRIAGVGVDRNATSWVDRWPAALLGLGDFIKSPAASRLAGDAGSRLGDADLLTQDTPRLFSREPRLWSRQIQTLRLRAHRSVVIIIAFAFMRSVQLSYAAALRSCAASNRHPQAYADGKGSQEAQKEHKKHKSRFRALYSCASCVFLLPLVYFSRPVGQSRLSM